MESVVFSHWSLLLADHSAFQALNQKKKIKDDYMARKKSEELAKKSKSDTKTSIASSGQAKQQSQEPDGQHPAKEYFPKSKKVGS